MVRSGGARDGGGGRHGDEAEQARRDHRCWQLGLVHACAWGQYGEITARGGEISGGTGGGV